MDMGQERVFNHVTKMQSALFEKLSEKMVQNQEKEEESGSSFTQIESPIQFILTGSAAHDRISPLLPSSWRDLTSTHNGHRNDKTTVEERIDFIWENAARKSTKHIRDNVKCYSHLPNGTCILDSKWSLARLFSDFVENDNSGSSGLNDDNLAVLDSYCFNGIEGFRKFAKKVGLLKKNMNENNIMENSYKNSSSFIFPDLTMHNPYDIDHCTSFPSVCPSNLWVIKDANSNGAGGIWIVSDTNVESFLSSKNNCGSSSIFAENDNDRPYIAQKYAYPPVLYNERKCHVRAYALLTSDGRAFVHKRCFLHVANDPFDMVDNNADYESTIHITNCCANSHDESKFAGEICADFSHEEMTFDENDQTIIPLAPFWNSVCASVNALAKKSFPFLQGGKRNGGFEYLGLDFILSYKKSSKNGVENKLLPVAYLLEVNAPPSQDTATGLPHAENLHSEVMRDLLSLWVYPNVWYGKTPKPGGWKCVYHDEEEDGINRIESKESLILPSKAVILNKLKLALFERKQRTMDITTSSDKLSSHQQGRNQRTEGVNKHDFVDPEQLDENDVANKLADYARSHFPYFSSSSTEFAENDRQTRRDLFFESAGGAQVPFSVTNAVCSSLSLRHREKVGSISKYHARRTLSTILGCSESTPSYMFVGSNATSLLDMLAQKYMNKITGEDEIIICEHNHDANILPWVKLAERTGATIKWWKYHQYQNKKVTKPYSETCNSLEDLMIQELDLILTPSTKIIVMSHCSNVLGQVYNIKQIGEHVKNLYGNNVRLVVDGVAAVPHIYADLEELDGVIDWYVLSCHKLFSTHLGGLYGKSDAVEELSEDLQIHKTREDLQQELVYKDWEMGTISYEACAGVNALGDYLSDIGKSTRDILSSSICFPPSLHQSSQQQQSHECTSQTNDINNTRSLSSHIADSLNQPQSPILSKNLVIQAYDNIEKIELPLTKQLIFALTKSSSNLKIIEEKDDFFSQHDPNLQKAKRKRLPIISIAHDKIGSETIVQTCEANGIICRQSSFLSSRLLRAWDVSKVVRFSLAHYNKMDEIVRLVQVLEAIPCWND